MNIVTNVVLLMAMYFIRIVSRFIEHLNKLYDTTITYKYIKNKIIIDVAQKYILTASSREEADKFSQHLLLKAVGITFKNMIIGLWKIIQYPTLEEITDENLLKFLIVTFGAFFKQSKKFDCYMIDFKNTLDYKPYLYRGTYACGTILYCDRLDNTGKILFVEIFPQKSKSYIIKPTHPYWPFAKAWVCNCILTQGVPDIHFDTHLALFPISTHVKQLSPDHPISILLCPFLEYYSASENFHYIQSAKYGLVTSPGNPLSVQIEGILKNSQNSTSFIKLDNYHFSDTLFNQYPDIFNRIITDYRDVIAEFVSIFVDINIIRLQSNETMFFLNKCISDIPEFPKFENVTRQYLIECLTMIIVKNSIYHSLQHKIVFSYFDMFRYFSFRMRLPVASTVEASLHYSERHQLSDYVWKIDKYQYYNFIELEGKSIIQNDIVNVSFNFNCDILQNAASNFRNKLQQLKSKYQKKYNISWGISASIHL
jgi:hypothetical protein